MAILFVTRNDRKALISRYCSWLDQRSIDVPVHITHEDPNSANSWMRNEAQIVFHTIPKLNAHHFPEWIRETVRENGIKCVVPLGDRDLLPLVSNLPLGEGDKQVRLASESSFPRLAQCLDKATFSNLSGKTWSVPRFVIASDQAYNEIVDKIGPPPWVKKPRNGTSSKEVQIIRNEKHYNDANRQPEYVIQSQIEGAPITVDVLRNGSNFQISARYRKHVVGSQSVVMSPCTDVAALDAARDIVRAINLDGIWNFQVIESEGHFFLHDVNPRPSSGIFYSIARGMSVFEFITGRALGESFGSATLDHPIRSDLEMCIYQEYELRDIAKF